jgi:hypothetical protein
MKFPFALIATLLLAGPASAWTLVEPTTSVGGGALVGLESCQVTMVPEFAAFAPSSVTFNASSTSGGGAHNFTITDEIPSVQGRVNLSATCRNPGGEGAATIAVDTFPVLLPSNPNLHQ